MATTTLWDPHVEARFLAWQKMVQAQEARHAKPGPCITISREFGCQAYPVAEALVKRLNAGQEDTHWTVVDKQVLEEVAKISGYSVDQLEKSRDTPPFLKAIFSMFLDDSRAEETEIFAYTRTAIQNFAKRGNCILIGRGATLVTQNLPNCLHFRLVAPLSFRVQKIMNGHGLSETEARDYIKLHQKLRDDFTNRIGGGRLDDPQLYNLIVNNERLPAEKIAELIEKYLQLRG